jgi:hypothetical protein
MLIYVSHFIIPSKLQMIKPNCRSVESADGLSLSKKSSDVMSLPNGAKNNRLDPVLAIALKITHPIQVVKDNFLIILCSSSR